MAQLDTGNPTPDPIKKERHGLSGWLRLGIGAGVLIVVVGAIAALMAFVTGVPLRESLIENTVWHLQSSEITVEGQTTPLTIYPDTEGIVFVKGGGYLAATNDGGWTFANTGTWKIGDDGLVISNTPTDATWTWGTLVLEYQEGALLKHEVYTQGESFDIRTLAPGVWQGPADMWLDWYKFEGETITLAEDYTFELGDLTGTWSIDEYGSIDVDIDSFEDMIPGLFVIVDSQTLSLQDPLTGHSLALLDRAD